MKKFAIVSALLLFIFSFCPLALALSVGPIEPAGHLKWAVSVEDSYTIDRDIEPAGDFSNAGTEKVNQGYAKITLGLTDYFNVYAKLGAVTGSEYHFTSSGTDIDYETDTTFLWGIGVSGIYKFADTWRLIGDIQYSLWNPDIDKATYGGTAGTNIATPGVENAELQLSGLLSYDFDLGNETIITPYLGAAYLYYKTKTEGTLSYTAGSTSVITSWSLKGDDSLMGIAGLGVKVYNNWTAFAEGRFGAEGGVSGGLNYNF